MKALIRKPFHYATRDMLIGTIVDLPDAVFEEFKRERLVTDAPAEVVLPAALELPLAAQPVEVPAATFAAPVTAPAPAHETQPEPTRTKSKRK
jgi:hypothetical protein